MVNVSELLGELQQLRESGYLSDALLRHAVRKIAQGDDKFDWVGVYLLADSGEELWLHNYMGAPTEHAKIPVGQGICGTAAETGENQIVPDVSAVDNYLACDPDVKSEAVILIKAGSDVLGQIDIDSKQADAFEDDDVEALEMVADKLAEQMMAERR